MFLIAAALLVTVTTVLTMVPAAYAGGDNDDDDDDHNGDGNNQKAEEDSAGVLADCDKNEASNIYICSAITPICRPGAVCVYGDVDPTLIALPISWR
ncbi:MAG TPA: hypothetical protein VKA95_00185 [Nitrososphaeraceae archaeon]|nr:hypothetical protein [Nitrososphaeraceae archaeon]